MMNDQPSTSSRQENHHDPSASWVDRNGGMINHMSINGARPKVPVPGLNTGIMSQGFNPHALPGMDTMRQPLQNGVPFNSDAMPNITAAGNSVLDADIPKSDFMRAINFDSLPQFPIDMGAVEEELSGRMDEDELSLPRGMNTSIMSNGFSNNLDASFDLFEHHQAKEQARLLHRFKELRQAQMQQQEELMRRQQEQMEKLRGEQQLVQTMIARQRVVQWGGTGKAVAVHGNHGNLPRSPPQPLGMVTPPPSKKSRPQSTIPQALARGAVAHAKTHSIREEQQVVSQPVPQYHNLPQPILPIARPASSHESELDSETGTLSTGGIMREEGVYYLPDTASEASESLSPPQSIPHLRHPMHYQSKIMNELRNPASFQRQSHNTETSTKDILIPPEKFQSSVPNISHRNLPNQNLADKNWFHNSVSASELDQSNTNSQQKQGVFVFHGNEGKVGMTQQQMNGNFPAGRKVNDYQTSILVPPADKIQVKMPEVMTIMPNLDSVDLMLDNDHITPPPSQKVISAESDSGVYADTVTSKEGSNGDYRDVARLESEISVEDDKTMEENEEIVREVSEEVKPVSYDEVPIAGFGGQKKSFEELLEEELRREEERLKSSKGASVATSSTSNAAAKKQFLRKGGGTARFGVPQSPQQNANKKMPIHQKKVEPTMTKEVVKKAKSVPTNTNKTVSRKVVQKSPVQPPHPLKLKLKPSPKKVGNSAMSLMVEDPKGNTTMEISFQNMVQKKEEEEKQEIDELEEFELLEQYADDNASFSSASSFVKKVVSSTKPLKKTEISPLVKKHSVESDSDEGSSSDSSLNDTESDSISDVEENDDTLVDEEEIQAEKVVDDANINVEADPAVKAVRTMHRKVAVASSKTLSQNCDSIHSQAMNHVDQSVVGKEDDVIRTKQSESPQNSDSESNTSEPDFNIKQTEMQSKSEFEQTETDTVNHGITGHNGASIKKPQIKSDSEADELSENESDEESEDKSESNDEIKNTADVKAGLRFEDEEAWGDHSYDDEEDNHKKVVDRNKKPVITKKKKVPTATLR